MSITVSLNRVLRSACVGSPLQLAEIQERWERVKSLGPQLWYRHCGGLLQIVRNTPGLEELSDGKVSLPIHLVPLITELLEYDTDEQILPDPHPLIVMVADAGESTIDVKIARGIFRGDKSFQLWISPFIILGSWPVVWHEKWFYSCMLKVTAAGEDVPRTPCRGALLQVEVDVYRAGRRRVMQLVAYVGLADTAARLGYNADCYLDTACTLAQNDGNELLADWLRSQELPLSLEQWERLCALVAFDPHERQDVLECARRHLQQEDTQAYVSPRPIAKGVFRARVDLTKEPPFWESGGVIPEASRLETRPSVRAEKRRVDLSSLKQLCEGLQQTCVNLWGNDHIWRQIAAEAELFASQLPNK